MKLLHTVRSRWFLGIMLAVITILGTTGGIAYASGLMTKTVTGTIHVTAVGPTAANLEVVGGPLSLSFAQGSTTEATTQFQVINHNTVAVTLTSISASGTPLGWGLPLISPIASVVAAGATQTIDVSFIPAGTETAGDYPFTITLGYN